MKTYKEFLEKAYSSIDEGWVSPNLPRLVSRLGSLENQLSTSRRYSPEYARYRRVADVTSQSRNNPNTPFNRPSGDDYLNSVWNKFSSRIKPQLPSNPVQKPSSTRATLPSSNSRFRGGASGELKDRMGDYFSDLRKRGTGPRIRGGSSSLSNVGRGVQQTPSGINFIPGTGGNFGISGIGLAN